MKNDQRQAELQLAQEIVSVLPQATVARVVTADRDSISYRVNGDGMRLQTIVLRRESLARLANDPLRDVKLECLKRDLRENARVRRAFAYPHAWRFGGFEVAHSAPWQPPMPARIRA